MNILIIGGAGFIGSNMVRHCLKDPANCVTVLDSLEPQLHATTKHLKPIWNKIRFIRGSMGDEHLIAEAVQQQDVIYNLAAQTSHPLSIQDPLLDVQINCMGNVRLLEAIRLLNPQAVVVYTSSSTVTGKAVHPVIDEEHPEHPLDIYSANKGVAEKYYQIYHSAHDLKTVVLRLANIYGPFGKGSPQFGFINYFISLALQDKAIQIYGSGDQLRNIMHVDDACQAMMIAAANPAMYGRSCFAAHDQHLSVGQIAQTIVQLVGTGQVTHIPWPDARKRIEVDNVRISSKVFRELTGWRPSMDFEQGLAATRQTILNEQAPSQAQQASQGTSAVGSSRP